MSLLQLVQTIQFALPTESEELKSLLENAEANVELHWENRGHQLTIDEVKAAAKWYRII